MDPRRLMPFGGLNTDHPAIRCASVLGTSDTGVRSSTSLMGRWSRSDLYFATSLLLSMLRRSTLVELSWIVAWRVDTSLTDSQPQLIQSQHGYEAHVAFQALKFMPDPHVEGLSVEGRDPAPPGKHRGWLSSRSLS